MSNQEYLIPRTREIFEVRKQLSNPLSNSFDANRAIGIKGVGLFEKKIGGRCSEYILGHKSWDKAEKIEKSQPIPPRPGALAFYYGLDDRLIHIGQMAEGGYIISKWGLGYVYKHLPPLVPFTYGDIIRFYKSN